MRCWGGVSFPVLACAARPGIGVDDVASAIVRYLPPPTVRREIKGKDAKNGELDARRRSATRRSPCSPSATPSTISSAG